MCLLVNGNAIKEVYLDPFSEESFKPIYSTLFGSQKINIGDNLQIGIRTWVTDNAGKKVYDSDYFTTSNSICLLNKSLTAFLKS